MTEELNDIYSDLRSSNDKTLNHLDNELMKVRAGKATPSMLHGVMVDYYGTPTPLQQVANISTLDARTISVQAWEKSMLTEIAKGIMIANLGLNPQNNGETILIAVPPLTEERRRDLVKKAKAEGENAKVGIRNNRKDALDFLKELKESLSEDVIKDAENQIQSITDGFVKKVDEKIVEKEKDIMTI
ncbi:MAG: ribosome recycling factor [Crocinitomicaceae bacterium]|nr:ribosome recycling factor [Crocinitomicaceae bacterium]